MSRFVMLPLAHDTDTMCFSVCRAVTEVRWVPQPNSFCISLAMPAPVHLHMAVCACAIRYSKTVRRTVVDAASSRLQSHILITSMIRSTR